MKSLWQKTKENYVVKIICGVILGYIIGATLYGIYANASPTVQEPMQETKTEVREYGIEADKVHQLVNDERVKLGLKPLERSVNLDKSAQFKADELTKEGAGENPHINSKGVHGYEYIWSMAPECEDVNASENLFVTQSNFSSSKTAVESLMSSKAHREAMLSAGITKVGYSYSGGYLVQHMC